MTTVANERRRLPRVAASHPAVVFDENGRLLARGLTSNISATGLLVITRTHDAVSEGTVVEMELIVPAVGGRSLRSRSARHSREHPRSSDRSLPWNASILDESSGKPQVDKRRYRRKRIVRLRGRIIRTVSLGHLVGMGIELI